MAKQKLFNQRMRGEGISSMKAIYRSFSNGEAFTAAGLSKAAKAARSQGIRTVGRAGSYYSGKTSMGGGRVLRASNSTMIKRYGKTAAGAAVVGTVLYGFSNHVGRTSGNKGVRAYKKTAYIASRTVAVPGQFLAGTAKGYLNTGSPIVGLKRGASRAMTSMEGKNSATGRKNTLAAKQRRDVIQRNRVVRAKAAAPANRGGKRTFWARDSKGHFA